MVHHYYESQAPVSLVYSKRRPSILQVASALIKEVGMYIYELPAAYSFSLNMWSYIYIVVHSECRSAAFTRGIYARLSFHIPQSALMAVLNISS